MIQNLPKDIKENGRFCLWRYEKQQGRQTKVPYQISGQRASSRNIQHFTSFEEVIKAVPRYDGIGMGVFSPFAAVDIDDCVKDGELSGLAEDVIHTLDSYTEYSPSGKGVHIIVKVKDFAFDKSRYYINNRKIGLEVYVPGATNRFVTLTGNTIHQTEPAYRDEELQLILDSYMKRDELSSPQRTVPGSYLEDESVIRKAQKSRQKEKFLKLWQGNISGYASPSEADLALCSMLAFWCGGDMEQMDRIFRQSGLMRDKWERDDYRKSTLERAVKSCTSFYKPVRVTYAADDFNNISGQLQDFDLLNNPRYRFGDIGFGRLFADVYKDICRFVPERKKWYVFSGKCWQADVGSLKAMELCKSLADDLLQYALTINEEHLRTNFLKECGKWQQRRFRETYLKEAQSIYPLPFNTFDQDRYLLNCQNGTLDLRTMQFHEHKASDFLSKIAGASYLPEVRSERFEQYIDEIMSGDLDKAKFLQKSLGYAVTGDTRHECLFFLYGETSRNGKGTLMESVLKVLGDYGRAVRPETIAQKRFTNSQAPSEDIARLVGIRLANISEPGRGLLLNAAQVKTMTGNDTLNARFLHENSFDFEPQFKLYINTNYLPIVNDMTLFSSGRVIIIPFNRHFDETEQDRSLKERFAKPDVQSAILNWLIRGYQLLCEEGLKPPKAVQESTAEYARESNKVIQFIEESLIEDSASEIKTSLVYEAYRTWCVKNGHFPENNRNFNHELRKVADVARKRPKTGGNPTTLLLGYRLKVEDFLP
ncbi:MAG TPA: nucleoside triphosphatase [Bacteroidales bacterium]|nr:nucleoside triphosphatase [Bacteroidales bacterium]